MEDEEQMKELYDAMKRHPSAKKKEEDSHFTEIENSIVRAVNLYRKAVSK